MRLLHADSADPKTNAAFEESLYRAPGEPTEAVLLFYRNAPSVHCGRNQFPAAECAVSWCARQGIPVLKRCTGGGTVFHDLGNLNYAFVLPRRLYDPARVIGLAKEALLRIGVPDVTMCPRFSLWHGGDKIGGSAFALAGQRALLHGCIPFGTDLETLTRALTPEAAPPEDKVALRSVPSPVANVAPLMPNAPEAEEAMARFADALAAIARDALP